MSPDGSSDIYHYEENGTLINVTVTTPKDSNDDPLVISGVIVGVGALASNRVGRFSR
jgi:hypothetical protein